MNAKRVIPTLAVGLLLNIPLVRAHCPLCTIGAAAAAGGAMYLGVSTAVIGLFIGAFAVSIGWWIARVVKKQIIPYQKPVIIAVSFITTVLPLMPLLTEVHPLYLPWLGVYGRTLVIDLFLIGSILGGVIVAITPSMSKKITAIRGKMLPYQGTVLTLLLLLVIGIIAQVIL